jgi:preprotein translocase SecE subunit
MLLEFKKRKIKMAVFSVRRYFNEVIGEFKKVVFPTKKDTYTTSIYIGVVVAITACIVSLTDFLISHIIKIIFGLN